MSSRFTTCALPRYIPCRSCRSAENAICNITMLWNQPVVSIKVMLSEVHIPHKIGLDSSLEELSQNSCSYTGWIQSWIWKRNNYRAEGAIFVREAQVILL